MSSLKKIRVGSRASRLAVVQVEEVHNLLKDKGRAVEFKRFTYQTEGDKDKITPLTDNPADDFFTDALDQALLNREIDVAIHSAKDMPQQLTEGLAIFALTPALDDTDAFIGKGKLHELKAGARIGTSSALRQQSIRELYPQLETADIRGNIEERIVLFEKGKYDGIIVATAALKRLGLGHLITDIFPWEATPLQGQLAVVGRREDGKLRELFSAIDVRRQYGTVTLVGAGPGDPSLITVKGIDVLKRADIVFYDYLVDKRLLEYAPQAERNYVGKRKGEHSLPQRELSKMLKAKAMQGKKVVRLKGGDPLIFGRGADEIVYLKNFHIPVEVVPGVSSATGIPSGLGIPLTAREVSSSVAFISGHGRGEGDRGDDTIKIPQTETIVFLMGLTKLDVIINSLLKAGWAQDTPVIVISKGTRSDEKIVKGTIADIKTLVAAKDLEPPALIIVGQTVNFWNDQLKERKKTLYLGTNPEKYKILGEIVHLPMIKISETQLDRQTANQIAQRLSEYDIILFTSRFAVRYFLNFLQKEKYPPKQLKDIDIVVIGTETAEALKAYDLRPKFVAATETGEGMFEVIKKNYGLSGLKILFPRSALPNPYLKDALTQEGSMVDEITIYQNTKPQKRELPANEISQILFTSPSTVKNFLEDYGTIAKHWRILCRGPLTQKALNKAGYQSELIVSDSS